MGYISTNCKFWVLTRHILSRGYENSLFIIVRESFEYSRFLDGRDLKAGHYILTVDGFRVNTDGC